MRDSQDPGGASGSVRTRSASLDTDCHSASSDSKKKDPKTFSMTIFVNEHEKNKIVDLLHKAKSIISKKVEKVMGIKQRSPISNADALQTVLETWMTREQEEEREDNIMVEKLIKEQEKQVESLIQSGNFKTVPTLAVEEDDDDDEDEDTIEEELDNDLEVSRLTIPRYLKPPVRRRVRSISETSASVRSLSPLDTVPCPFGLRPESELYPPRLRRPSALYGAGAAAACSRPPSRQVSISPSVQEIECQLQEKLQVHLETDKSGDILQEEEQGEYEAEETEEAEQEEEAEEEEEEEEEDDYNELPSRYARPDSFIIPIGGVWRPGEEGEVRWGTVTSEQEYQQELRKEEEGEDCDGDPLLVFPLLTACFVSSDQLKLTISLILNPITRISPI